MPGRTGARVTDPAKICERLIEMASCIEPFGDWQLVLAWNLGVAGLLDITCTQAHWSNWCALWRTLGLAVRCATTWPFDVPYWLREL